MTNATLATLGRASLAAVLLIAASMTARSEPAPSCAATIGAVMADIAARDLATHGAPPLNAFLTLNPLAIEQAAALDRSAAAGAAKGPLFCVPIAVKDNFDTYDMPATAGSLALMGNQPPRDAPFVARLRAAGAIIVGKTNMDEFAMGIRGLSGAGGRVGNAYDTRMSPGGSSSGSGVAVGAGFVPLAVGSDNCGSLRIPAVYNGAVSLRATDGRFDTAGIFPIGFVNGVPGMIARDSATLNRALTVASDGWRSANAEPTSLRGKRIGTLRRFKVEDPWAGADQDTQARFTAAIALMREAGAEIIDNVAIDDVDPRLGPEYLKGFARKVDAAFARYPASRRNWRDVCTSGRIRPEWSAEDCTTAGASAPQLEQLAVSRIARNRAAITAAMARHRLDALAYPTDAMGGARADDTDRYTCFIASTSGLPAVAFPVGLDTRGMPLGLELMGRANDDEALVAMMAAFEQARGTLPDAKRGDGNPALAKLDIARQNELRRQLGWRAFQSRRGKDLGALRPERFRVLTDEMVKAAIR